MEQQVAGRTPAAETGTELDEIQLRTFLQRVRDNQNIPLALIGGIAAASIGAVIWAMITIWTNYQIGWMAIGVGFLVGYSVRVMGKGIDRIFGFVGAALALLGCVAGNLLMISIIIGRQENMMLLDVLSRLSPPVMFQLLKVTFQPIDVLFYAIAVYEGYVISFLPVIAEDVAKMRQS